MIKKRYHINLSGTLEEITLISRNKVSFIKKLTVFFPTSVLMINNQVEIIIEDQKITNVILNPRKLKENGFNEEEIDEVYEKLTDLIKKDEETLIKESEKFNIDEIYDLDSLAFATQDTKNYFFENVQSKKVITRFVARKDTNKLYLEVLIYFKNRETDILYPMPQISEELIKQNKKFRLKFLLKNFK